MMTLWHEKIEDDPDLWRSELVKPSLVDIIRSFFDENGTILEGLSSL